MSDRPSGASVAAKMIDQVYPSEVHPLAMTSVDDLADVPAVIFSLGNFGPVEIRQVRALCEEVEICRKSIFAIRSRSERARAMQAEAFGFKRIVFLDDGSPAVQDAVSAIFEEDYKAALEKAAPLAGDTFFACSKALLAIGSELRQLKPVRISRALPGAGKVSHAVSIEGVGQMVKAASLHHDPTCRHSIAVAGYAAALGQALDLAEEDLRLLAMTGLLHDIGKMLIPVSLQEKAGRLDHGEVARIREHPELGAKILRMQGGVEPVVVQAVRSHHEYLDGSGYPFGLKGERISPLSRMVTIADTFAALTERRAYRPAKSPAEAIAIMAGMAGSKIDAGLLAAFRPIVLDTAFARRHPLPKSPGRPVLKEGIHPLRPEEGNSRWTVA
ncbi:HD domain-containing protein [Rhizobiales bacterium]|uniref:HD-GYP domain-containing protein n=1 Tax=Hongsoonwoonella zoysiae TaxID=2821844 RepID=UPI00155FFA91|nr:HD domain-containing phosphohydrolase [Hongsoonwoonella zoysiae]NRG18014.1 HD domain-containing protein [Hongsoonwoonella zoysiae]